MATVKIVTDSTADLPAALRSAYDITVMPLKVIFKDEIYREGVDITIPAFFEKLAGTEQLPTTSQPSPAEFQEVYEELTADGSTVISMHISSKMSGTIQSAMLAKKNLPDRDIRVIDSGKVTMALGLGVLVGARAAQAGRSADEVEALVQEMFNHKIKIYFMVDTFENLQKGGRIGKAAALLGTLLNIKPILTVEDGLVAPFEKVRGKTKAVERLVALVEEHHHRQPIEVCAFLHADALDEAVNLQQRILNRIKPQEMIMSEIGAVVGTHAGAGTVGVIFY